MVKVSVIVPVYNVAPYLARCLDSLVGQTLHDIEIICIDDKSTDNSLEILHEYRNKDPRIQVIALDKNSGVSTARNTGIEAARGEYLGFVDSDDYVDTDFYEHLYAKARADNADIVRGAVEILDYNSSISGHDEIFDIQKHGKWRFHWQWWCAIYNSNMIKSNKILFPIDIISGQDTVFLQHSLTKANNVGTCPETSYHYIRREGSLDEKIMPPHKIDSRIKAHKLIAQLYNNSSEMKHEEYTMAYISIMHALMMHFFKNTSYQCKQDVATAVISLYKDCKFKQDIAQHFKNIDISFAHCLQSYDTDGLVANFNCLMPILIKQPVTTKSFFAFGVFKLLKIISTKSYFIIKIFGIQIIKLKYQHKNSRFYILYLPILRIKNK